MRCLSDQIRRIETRGDNGDSIEIITKGRPFIVKLALRVNSPADIRTVGIAFVGNIGGQLFTTMQYDSMDLEPFSRVLYRFDVSISPSPFLRGSLNMNLVCYGADSTECDITSDANSFNVTPSPDSKDVFKWRPGIVDVPS
jgi:hypothetical protein